MTMFFAGTAASGLQPLALRRWLLTADHACSGVLMTVLRYPGLLSATILKGMPSSFTLELPPYRKPTDRPA